jgi:RimJ/RimL family protein N-acetyltransferase
MNTVENIWNRKKINLRAFDMEDLEEYFLNPVDSYTQIASDRILFPLGKEKVKERVEFLSKLNPNGEEFFMIIEDKNKKPVGNINTYECNRMNGTFEYGISILSGFRKKGMLWKLLRY